ncbi:hypothetical protein E2562_034684 [Oryza meyeriana var. granulata]|uniref:Uncharacterized protein n=1 Tax=Oryza meyeriana var. granulata TaxID=110450 RepID=A0A6G1C1X0_9ORYZ|nr:hypothetical protein E2562_034684 [Oryza meyeriana var. granulata]
MAHAAVACKGDGEFMAAAGLLPTPTPAADLFKNSMHSSTASLRYESAYAVEGLILTAAARLDVATAADRPGDVLIAVGVCCCCCGRAPFVDAADSIASLSTTSRTRSNTDTGAAPAEEAAALRGRRAPPPPRSLGMHVTVVALRGSAKNLSSINLLSS